MEQSQIGKRNRRHVHPHTHDIASPLAAFTGRIVDQAVFRAGQMGRDSHTPDAIEQFIVRMKTTFDVAIVTTLHDLFPLKLHLIRRSQHMHLQKATALGSERKELLHSPACDVMVQVAGVAGGQRDPRRHAIVTQGLTVGKFNHRPAGTFNTNRGRARRTRSRS